MWDCCAASGGKSILMADCFGQMDLVVSDIRKSILENLKERFHKAGIKKYRSCVADLSIPASAANPIAKIISSQPFDLILCDAPCTGSGTWGRTPESLYFFSQDKIAEYAALQRKIISNTITNLKKGGYFLYSTCSVFTAENEANIAFIQKQFQLTLIRQELFTGYAHHADTLFAALFKKG
jgi:16S rRNA (cytosine967-C5)-methyltransferase